ncbi:hypothetical protein J437_LFUL014450 [Ladona fulva]|uniref:Uncharacterized protein n=1 Tax=Ladona fulva TaxID=123851 RepID=A0A8K0P7V6_LADFU|nr:hypothetical protein J437_LFUL014450 [Ladona fulva]
MCLRLGGHQMQCRSERHPFSIPEFVVRRFLAMRVSFTTISFGIRLGKSTVAAIVYDSCRVTANALLSKVIPMKMIGIL